MSEARPKTFKDKARMWFKALDSPLAFVSLVFAAAFGYFTIVEWRVRAIVKDPEFLAEVARRSRPAMVIDSEGRVLSDMGALSLLEGVPGVEAVGPSKSYVKITIKPRTMLPAEPIVQALDEANVSVTAARGHGVSWEVVLVPRFVAFAFEGATTNLAAPRFRIEIVPP